MEYMTFMRLLQFKDLMLGLGFLVVVLYLGFFVAFWIDFDLFGVSFCKDAQTFYKHLS